MLLGAIARKLSADAKTVATMPARTVRKWSYTVQAVRRGELPASEVLKVILSTIGATLVVLALLFPIYWILMAALSGSGSSLYTSDSFSLLPSDPTIQPFIWVIGDLIVPSYTISAAIPFTDLAFVFQTPGIEILDASDYGVDRPSEFKRFLWNSLMVAIPTVLIAMSLIVPAAYALSRREFLFRRKILFVHIQVLALQNNDPATNEGINTTWQFASPSNRDLTGPYSNFVRTIESGFEPLLNATGVRYGPLDRDGDTASQPVTVVDANGTTTSYRWTVEKQSDAPYEGCWMTAGVAPT